MRITTVPATKNIFTSEIISNPHKRKVAGYARVSTDHEDQVNSYEAQVDYYTHYIQSRDDWEFVRVYADEGITGCNTKARAGFNSMVADALAGKINLIVTKSVSRFARNTVDSLSTIRKLKEVGCEVYFEKESIWTFDAKGELLITIMSSLAQEESRSISENTTWGKRKRFADGKPSVAFSRFLGYDRGPHGEFVINSEQAETVRLIYRRFLGGLSTSAIAKELTQKGIKTPSGKDKWMHDSVLSILRNEKYAGNAILQKTYTESFLTKKSRKNEGQVEQYFVENSHPAIIPPALFEEVQSELERRKRCRYSGVSIFASRIKCGQCGGWYGAKIWHSTEPYRKTVYRCNHRYDKDKLCTTPHFTEEQIKGLFVKGFNQLAEDKDAVIAALEGSISSVCDTAELQKQQEELEKERLAVAEKINNAIQENAKTVQNQDEYEILREELTRQYGDADEKLKAVTREISDRMVRRNRMMRFIETLKGVSGLITEFDETLWCSTVDCITAYSDTDIRIAFKGGMEVKV